MNNPNDSLTDALRNLNYAAYSAMRAGKGTINFPALREIAHLTDKLFDDHQKGQK